MLRAVFRINPKLSDKFFISGYHGYEPFWKKNKKLSVNIEFDSGDIHEFTTYDQLYTRYFGKFMNYINIPKKATKITITSNNNITHYGCPWKENPAIISIEEFTSDSITDCDNMFYGFINLKEIKNINLNWGKITSANNMCYNWKSFNSILPDDFCKNMKSLKDAQCMFGNWKLFNQRLPKYFCSNMISIIDADDMFINWKLFNQKLSDKFCSNMVSLARTNYMFCNWNSYEYELPNKFFPDTSYISNHNEIMLNDIVYEYDYDFMFWGWFKCNNTPKYKLPKYLYNYKQKNIDDLNYLLEKHKEKIIDYKLMSKLVNKDIVLCIKGNIDHYVYIENGRICLLDEYHRIFTYKPNNVNKPAIIIS